MSGLDQEVVVVLDERRGRGYHDLAGLLAPRRDEQGELVPVGAIRPPPQRGNCMGQPLGNAPQYRVGTRVPETLVLRMQIVELDQHQELAAVRTREHACDV